ncbi:MAG: hypothetical protein ACR2NF_11800, partial [Pirellulales bacterium]
MSSSRRTRRRQQNSYRRHRMRLESLEKRYALNAAPILDPSASPQLNSVIEDAGIPVGQVGTLVSSLIDTGGTHNNFSDADGDLPGIAITGTNLQGGTLYYSTNNGVTWLDAGFISTEDPRFLLANNQSRIFFQPQMEFTGTISDVISFNAWDGRSIWQQLGQEIAGESTGDYFGDDVSISDDGSTIAVSAPFNDGNGSNSGHVRVFRLSGSSWTQIGDDINGENYEDQSGKSISLSSDGNTIAIGDRRNNGNHHDGNAYGDGHVRIFRFNGSSWSQIGGDIDGSNDENMGSSVCLSNDGNTVAIGSPFYHSGSNTYAGIVRVFTTDGVTWTQVGQDIVGPSRGDFYGAENQTLSLSSDAKILAIGAKHGNDDVGHVRIFKLNGSSWIQLGSDLVGQGADDWFGNSVSLSADGETIAVGATNYTLTHDSGHVSIFVFDGLNWLQLGQSIPGLSYHSHAGHKVSLSSNGQYVTFAAHSPYGSQVYGYQFSDLNWVADFNSNQLKPGVYHWSSSLSADGNTLVTGSRNRDGNWTGAAIVYYQSPALSGNSDVVSVSVVPENTAPSELSLSNSTVGENSQGATVGQLATTDADVDDTFTYTLVPGSGDTDNSLFYIEGDVLKVGANLDYESSNTAAIRIRTTDSHGEYFEKAFSIGVQNYNEPPTDILLSSSSIEEKKPAGSVVGTLTSVDPDGSNFNGFAESFTYSLANGNGDADNGSFEIIGDELRARESFNYEVKDSYTVRIQTADNMGVMFEKQFLINISNVNDAPVLDPSASPQLNSVTEDAGIPVGQVGTLVSDLIDVGGTHNNFSDADGDLPGIAITGTNLQGGSLYYSTDDGATWQLVSAVTPSSSLTLLADSQTRIYFSPGADLTNEAGGTFTFRAWDRTGAST